MEAIRRLSIRMDAASKISARYAQSMRRLNGTCTNCDGVAQFKNSVDPLSKRRFRKEPRPPSGSRLLFSRTA
jgi:hypothetical protein